MRFRWTTRCGQALLLSVLLSVSGCDFSTLVTDDLADARSAIQEHNWPLAERLLERYLRQEQDADKRWEAWLGLVQVVGNAGADRRAVLDYLEAMLMEYAEDESRTREILQRMGGLNENLRRYDRAAEVWSTYIDLSNLTEEEAVQAHRRLARIHFRAGRFDASEDVLQDCLALAGLAEGKIQCLYDLADMNMAQERWQEASDLALQILELNVDATAQGLAAFLLGDALEQQKKFSEALAYFEKSRAGYPNAMVVDNRIAFLKNKLKLK